MVKNNFSILKRPINTIKTKLRRARQMLVIELTKKGEL